MLKKLSISILLLFSLTLISCSDTVLNNPNPANSGNSGLQKPADFSSSNVTQTISHTTVSKTINGNLGGTIRLTGIYVGLDLRIITVDGTLSIPAGAFQGTKTITLFADYSTPGIICEPSMEFDVPLTLDLKYIGLDLRHLGFNHNNIIFAYLEDDGSAKPVVNEGIDFGLLSGLLGVRQAKIEHFSRYGFTR